LRHYNKSRKHRSKEQSRLTRINKAKSSKKLRKIYRIRRKRFKHAINCNITKRFKEKTEEHGIKIEEVSEQGTSSLCPFCSSESVSLFYEYQCSVSQVIIFLFVFPEILIKCN